MIAMVYGDRMLVYMSFATKEEFLGAVIVEASGAAEAHVSVTLLGLNPGGEVMFVENVSPSRCPAAFRNRLLSRKDLNQLQASNGCPSVCSEADRVRRMN